MRVFYLLLSRDFPWLNGLDAGCDAARRVGGYTRRLAVTRQARRPRVQPVRDSTRQPTKPVERIPDRLRERGAAPRPPLERVGGRHGKACHPPQVEPPTLRVCEKIRHGGVASSRRTKVLSSTMRLALAFFSHTLRVTRAITPKRPVPRYPPSRSAHPRSISHPRRRPRRSRGRRPRPARRLRACPRVRAPTGRTRGRC